MEEPQNLCVYIYIAMYIRFEHQVWKVFIIEWASAQVPPTPLYLGGTVEREREREREGEREGERERERERGEGEMDGWIDGWGWMDGWMDGWTDGWMDG